MTVLFADVAGSSEIASRLSPEELHALMDGGFEALAQAVHRDEGPIDPGTTLAWAGQDAKPGSVLGTGVVARERVLPRVPVPHRRARRLGARPGARRGDAAVRLGVPAPPG